MQFAPPRRKRRLVSLTPMIDVVFLLLVFFMLASKFTTERSLVLSGGGGGSGEAWEGAPRLIDVSGETLAFNGRGVTFSALAETLGDAGVRMDQPILIRVDETADVQRLTDVLDMLEAGDFDKPVLLP